MLNVNSVDPDQTPHSVASDLDLHSLPMSQLWDVKHKWVNQLWESANQVGRHITLKQRSLEDNLLEISRYVFWGKSKKKISSVCHLLNLSRE